MTEQEISEGYTKSSTMMIDKERQLLDVRDRWWKLWSRKIRNLQESLSAIHEELFKLDSELLSKVNLPKSHTAKVLASKEYSLIFSIQELAHRTLLRLQDKIQTRHSTYQFRKALFVAVSATIVATIGVYLSQGN